MEPLERFKSALSDTHPFECLANGFEKGHQLLRINLVVAFAVQLVERSP